MTACKENRSTGKIVIVDCTKSDLQKLPKTVQDAFAGKGNTWPKVVISDPAMTKIYGAYSYADLKPQEYRGLFRDARRAFDKDADADLLATPGEAKPEAEEAGDDEKPASAEQPADDDADFEPSDYESWKSSKGSTIQARLVAVDGKGRYVFETRSGKKIPVDPWKLQDASRKRAEAVVKGE